MSSILDGFNSVRQTLATQQFALSITQRNIANADDPAYTRQTLVYTGDEWEWARSGVQGITVEANRNRYLDYGISREMQSLGKSNVESEALQQIDAVFNGSGEGLQQALSAFFNSFASLAGTPEDLVLRQQVLSSANALCTVFHSLYSGIQQVQTLQDGAVADTVDEINSLTARIAGLNEKIQTACAAHSEEELTLRDSRQRLIEQLSTLTDLSYYETESGSYTVATRQGGLLVSGNESHLLSVSSSTSGGFQGVMLDGEDITATLQSGELGGRINLRDNTIAGYLDTLDDLAATIIDRVNGQHVLGSDLEGSDGMEFFYPVPSDLSAARNIAVAITDPGKIAAAESGAGAGSNTNAKALAALSDEKMFSSETMTAGEVYAGLIYRIGTAGKEADDQVSVQTSVLNQLKNQRDSASGVNMDEEAINIIKYQKAYQASARYATVLDALSDEILKLLGV